jgi:hypothetical protein
MKRQNRNLVILICLFLGALSAPIIYFGIDLLFFTDYQLEKKFNSIHIGAPKQEVISILGPPNEQDTSFHLGQYQGFEQEYIKAEKSGSKYYLFWYGEIDKVYVVGFNDKDQVIIKSCGGT